MSGIMRKLILSIHITLDGYMAGLNGEMDWHYENWSDEMAAESLSQLQQSGCLLVGRHTYQAMINYWARVAVSPLSTGYNRKYARTLCTLPKVVISGTMEGINRPEVVLLKGDWLSKLNAFKQQSGLHLIAWGGVNMAHALIKHHLVDEYRLWVAPVTLQTGIPLFLHPVDKEQLKLTQTQIFDNGVVLYFYQTTAN
jgi:dihydrofolate reductase